VLRAGLAAVMPLLAGSLSACAGTVAAPFRRPEAQALPPAREPLAGPLTYVALGASDAVGIGVAQGWRDGWVPLLTAELPAPARLVNLGVAGTTLREALDGQLPRAIAAQPDLVTIWLAVNDALGGASLGQYRADLDFLLRELAAKTRAAVAVGNVPFPPSHLDPWGIPDIVRRTVAGSWNRAIAASARAHGATVVDLYSRWSLAEHPEYIGADGLHPTAAGYRALAGAFAATLREQRILPPSHAANR
jgi:lysophospholipase L1-like esterase